MILFWFFESQLLLLLIFTTFLTNKKIAYLFQMYVTPPTTVINIIFSNKVIQFNNSKNLINAKYKNR
jgi:hypothetical protein